MDFARETNELEERYPGKSIFKAKEGEFAEIICEVDPTSEHREFSMAIAVIDRSQPHYHKETTEVYEVIKGVLTVYKDGKEFVLKPGEKLTINPGEKHSAEGDSVWVRVISRPGWKKEDHLIV